MGAVGKWQWCTMARLAPSQTNPSQTRKDWAGLWLANGKHGALSSGSLVQTQIQPVAAGQR